MSVEIAVFEVQEGRDERFVEAYDVIADAPNDAEYSRGAPPHRGLENPNTFALAVDGVPVDTHAAIMEEPRFEDFGDAVGPYLADRPEVRRGEAIG